MRTALVIQNSLRSLGGGELVCISTCRALQELGYHVRLVSDRFEPDEIEAAFGMGDVLKKCEQVKIPELGRKLARFSSVPGLFFAWRSRRFFEKQPADVIFVTRDPRRPDVLPERPLFRFMYEVDQLRHFWDNYFQGFKSLYGALYERSRGLTTFLALSPALVTKLKREGLRRTELVYPSYGRAFQPRPKKNQVVYVTFLAPQKELDDFCEIARQLPSYRFYLVCRDSARVNRVYDGYAKRVLVSKPDNVEYIEARIRRAPELLEESRIYLHTSKEPGMPISVMEAMSAGCMPITPREGGGGEVLEAAGIGFRYDTIEDAVHFVRSEMDEVSSSSGRTSKELTPQEIARRAEIFSPEAFRNRLRDVIEKDPERRAQSISS